jgi:hypothetical protein
MEREIGRDIAVVRLNGAMQHRLRLSRYALDLNAWGGDR